MLHVLDTYECMSWRDRGIMICVVDFNQVQCHSRSCTAISMPAFVVSRPMLSRTALLATSGGTPIDNKIGDALKIQTAGFI